jgi:putative RecB family exonuclease
VDAPSVTLLSHSRIATYASCPEKFRLLYIEEVPPEPQGAYQGGISVHRTIEWVEKEGDPFDPEPFLGEGAVPTYFEATMRNMVEEVGGPDQVRWSRGTEDLQWWLKYGPGMLRNYHQVRMTDVERGLHILPQFTEVELTLPIGDDALLRGRTDGVFETPDGQLVVRDYKTGRKMADSALQLAIYSKLLGAQLPFAPSLGELVYLRQTPQMVRFELDPFLAPAEAWLEGVLAGIRAGSFFLSPGPFCSSCSVRSSCTWGSKLGGNDANDG